MPSTSRLRRMSAQVSLSSLESSHSFPHGSPSRDSSHSSSSSALVSLPSLYVTFKVLQLVNTFRKRVKTRVQSTRRPKRKTSTRVTEDFCQDFERQAFEEIDRYLGRKSAAHSRKTAYSKSNRLPSTDNGSLPLKQSVTERPIVATAIKREEHSKSSEWYVHVNLVD